MLGQWNMAMRHEERTGLRDDPGGKSPNALTMPWSWAGKGVEMAEVPCREKRERCRLEHKSRQADPSVANEMGLVSSHSPNPSEVHQLKGSPRAQLDNYLLTPSCTIHDRAGAWSEYIGSQLEFDCERCEIGMMRAIWVMSAMSARWVAGMVSLRAVRVWYARGWSMTAPHGPSVVGWRK